MKKISSAIVIVLSFVFVLLLFFLQRTVSPVSGEVEMSALKQETYLYSDQYGIPHIKAKTDEDAFRVLGYKTASERLFQMDMMRRVVSGTLSEVLGERTLKADKMLRTLGFKRLSKQMIDEKTIEIDPKLVQLANAYLEGVHQFIEEGALPLEFTLLNYTPKKFELADILAVSGYMSLTFAEGIIGDVLFSDLMDKLPEEKISILRVGATTDYDYFLKEKKNEVLEEETNQLENVEKSEEKKQEPAKTVKNLKRELYKVVSSSLMEINNVVPLFHGSNSWVLSGKRTKSGAPILANDPHIAIGNPHVFYEAHISSPNYELYGHYIPLVPFAIMGHTSHSAWGITMSEVDDLNVYEEKINPKEPNQVQFKGEWQELTLHNETIKVKDQKDVSITIKSSSHGPLIDETKYGLMGKVLSLSWSALRKDNNVMMTFFKLPHVSTVDDFKQALDYATAPGLNISWVNKSGDIAWWMMGKYPKLPDGIKTDIALKGWDGSSEIERYFTIDENPHLVNPENGVIVSANYKPLQDEFKHFDGYWQPGGRFFRLEKLLAQKEIWDLESLKVLQTDLVLPEYEEIQKELLNSVSVNSLNSLEADALEIFRKWKGSSHYTSVGNAIFHMWSYYLYRAIYLDELGEEGFKAFGKTADFWHAFKALIKNKQHSFWDNINTNRVERGDDIILSSFKSAVEDLKVNFGDSASKWEWGRIHKVEFKHMLGSNDFLRPIYNIGPFKASGGRYIINNLGHKKYSRDFSVVHGPATRRLVDMASPEMSLGIIPTGNSGNPFSPHFDDQTALYLSGKYRLQEMNWEKIKKLPYLKFTK